MRNLITILSICFLLTPLSGGCSEAKIITYPAPQSEKMAESSYEVSVNGHKLDIYKALSPKFRGSEYYFCYFDFDGEVRVDVKSKFPFTKQLPYTATPEAKAAADKIYIGEICPDVFGKVEKQKYSMSFSADKPFKAIVIRNERRMPLVIFGNPIEKDAPKPDAENVLYFGAGVHYVGELELKSNQTMYVADGAVVKGIVFAKDAENISVRGRGIITADNMARHTGCNLKFINVKNIKIEGIITKDPTNWTVVFHNCKNVVLDDVKICAGRMINDDAIDICNTSDVKITNTFARAEDDIIAVKGMYGSGVKLGLNRNPYIMHRDNNLPCENISIDNCIFWSDSANVFRIGYECYAPYFKNIKCTNIYVPFYSDKPSKFTEYWVRAVVLLQPTEGMPITDVEFENMTVRSSGKDAHVIFAQPRIVMYGDVRAKGAKGEFGRIENCSFKNVKVVGKKGAFKGAIFVDGQDDAHKVKNFTVENAEYFGAPITHQSPNVHISKWTESVIVK